VLAGKGIDAIGVDDHLDNAVRSDQLELAGLDWLVVSPGWPPSSPLVKRAGAAGVTIISEVELAWRYRANRAANWLVLTGTNGKTTTVEMLHQMLMAAGRVAVAAGNVGNPLVTAVQDPAVSDFAVELSSFQLHYTASLQPVAAAMLNLAPDHLDWHGSFQAYAAAKARVFRGVQRAVVFNRDDPISRELAMAADAGPEVLRVGFTLHEPELGEVGIADGHLLDRAFSEVRELAKLDDLVQLAGSTSQRLGMVHQLPAHQVANALAAAALGLAAGIGPHSISQGLRAFTPGAHRLEEVAQINGVRYVNDSKATNPHAAAAALKGFADGSVVWIAGGLAKGLEFDDLIKQVKHKLKATVLIGADQTAFTKALEQHAPGLAHCQVQRAHTGAVMDQAVAQAARLAGPGDVVLLAPAAASMDQFADYQARGSAFTQAVQRLGV